MASNLICPACHEMAEFAFSKKISKYRYFAKLYSRNTRSTVLEKVDTDFRQQYDAFQYSIKSSQKAPFES
jgi:hypothetical protein